MRWFLAMLVLGAVFSVSSSARADDRLARWRRLTVDLPARPVQPTTRTAACELAGTLAAWISVYATEDAKKATFSASRVEVARLSPSGRRDGRLPVRIAYPIVADGWIDPDDVPFELLERVDVIKGHVWLAAGAQVAAFRGDDGRVQIARPGAPAGATRRPDPDGYAGPIRCEAIALVSEHAPSAPREGKSIEVGSGSVGLFEAPGGREIATLEAGQYGMQLNALEQRANWVHVRLSGRESTPANGNPFWYRSTSTGGYWRATSEKRRRSTAGRSTPPSNRRTAWRGATSRCAIGRRRRRRRWRGSPAGRRS
jgi:hypothetical protein